MLAFFIIQLSSCLFMTGLIWLVQINLYPLLTRVGSVDFDRLHEFHMNRITWVVAPMMFVELGTAVYLMFYVFDPEFTTVLKVNAALVIFLWVWTFFFNVPSHAKLKFDSDISKRQLVDLNWPRTIVWTLRSIILVYLSWNYLTGGSK